MARKRNQQGKEEGAQEKKLTAKNTAQEPAKEPAIQKLIIARVVPDTSVIIEGLLTKRIEKGQLKPSKVIIHESVMAELESQANKNKETGYLGLEEVKKLRDISEKYGFSVEFKGNRPTEFEIKHAKSGEIDSVIRSLAISEDATLVTADKVQALVAESKGVKVILYEFEEEEKPFILEKYFDAHTASVHIKEKCPVRAKKGKPGAWSYVTIQEESLDREAVKQIAKEIAEETSGKEDAFVESDRKGSTIIQFSNYRIVITRPPFSDGYEITAVRPVRKLSLAEYKLDAKILERIEEKAEGILIAGAPGQGKTTFAQALAEYYLGQHKVIKTIESPRDMALGDEITQYSLSHGNSHEIQDILLLSRPDYTFFDEMRNTDDFRLFSDLRLSGVGMIGVIHATRPIDAIQRFIGRIELGVIPHVVDTVLFVKDGSVSKAFSLSMQVKVPSGMAEADLARPIVTVNDFSTGRLEYEIYSYGEETVVVPVKFEYKTPAKRIAESAVLKEIRIRLQADAPEYANKLNLMSLLKAELVTDNRCRVLVPKGERAAIIGPGGERILKIEERLGIGIEVIEEEEKKTSKRDERQKILAYHVKADNKNVLLHLNADDANKEVDIYVNKEFLVSAISSKSGVIKINKESPAAKVILNAVHVADKLEIRGA